ncbi:MAG: discoidin domain-containing protein [candidate division KSB1 bacterium]|nr:discoidin domain-containing protein [candidate division KSB1 bacterium]MDZ7365007.1 discoidin domain-containing protein [candidate division KSB1 bacterium]MDZ7403402.1 discoidin domain-containing protein [candidate division KSB1 bacterium]
MHPGKCRARQIGDPSSSRSGYPPSYAVDGSTSTIWKSSSGGVQWLEIDLGAVYETDNASIRWDGSNRAKDFAFQYWNVATSSWVTLFSQTNNSSSTSIFNFPLTCAQKFRVYMTKPNSSRYYIKEAEINGCGCAAAIPKTDVGQFMQPAETLPSEIQLHPNFPNPFGPPPFNTRTSISFTLPKETDVTLKVYNVAGEEVITLVHARRGAGLHTAVFDATNLPSGLYFSVLQAGEVRRVQRLLFIK